MIASPINPRDYGLTIDQARKLFREALGALLNWGRNQLPPKVRYGDHEWAIAWVACFVLEDETRIPEDTWRRVRAVHKGEEVIRALDTPDGTYAQYAELLISLVGQELPSK